MLLVGRHDPAIAALAHRLTRLELPALEVDDIAAATELLSAHPRAVAMAALPCAEVGRSLKGDVKRLRKAADQPKLGLVAVGSPPEASVRRRLRSAGVRLGLWEPYDDTTLRFLLNHAMSLTIDSSARASLRVPAHIRATVRVGERTKEALVYSLSTGGAFLATPRAQIDGARISIELALPDGNVDADAVVVFSNVPGNTQRANIPLGMGARFAELSDESAAQIRSYVDARLAEIEI